MRAAVTGGAGFIGSHVVDALVVDGHEVLVLDDLSRGRVANIEQSLAAAARLSVTDVRDGPAVETAFRDFRPELVFHLAAQIDVRASMKDPAHDATVNVLGAINVFAAATAVGARRVVNTSTGGAIYGDTDLVPTPETVPADPASAYGLSKRTAETYGRWFGRTRGLDVVTLRYGNVYGPRQDPGGDAGVIAILCSRALCGERPTVYGDGLQTRDFVLVEDIAAANLAAALAPSPAHHEYNVGTGTEVTVLDLIDSVRVAAGLAPDAFLPQFAAARPGEVRRSCLDTSRARSELGLAAPTPLREGLARTLQWVSTLAPEPVDRSS